ncbi:hypothetical protein AALT52_01440 [Ligilactobacillus faecis]|uniref:Primase C-terminal 1 domain-containing protein n=1 Tax=Ligilactobacillus faecis TaxID=762833 RepID=A0ABV4DM61_9LACO
MKITDKHITNFNTNKAIEYLGQFPLWTVSNISTVDGKRKKIPLSATLVAQAAHIKSKGPLLPTIFELAQNQKRSIGCSPQNKGELLNLTDLDFPSLYGTNRTLYVDTKSTGFIALDIENDCTPEFAKTLLTLPTVYVEQSVSGGFHALIYLNKDVREKYSNLLDITTFKSSTPGLGTYEVFFSKHFITLTRYCIDKSQIDLSDGTELSLEDFLQIIQEESKKKVVNKDYTSSLQLSRDSIPEISRIITDSLPENVMNSMFEMSPADYLSDNSRYENAVVFKAANAIKRAFLMYKENDYMVKNTGKKYYQLSYQELVYAVYLTANRVIPPRAKHKTKRNGLPFLLYLSSLCINTFKRDEEQAYTQVKRKEV